MSKNKFFSLPLFLLLLLTFCSCQGTYKIEGSTTIGSFEGSTLHLRVYDGSKMTTIDSCVVRHGAFTFQGKRDSVEMAMVCYKDQSLMPVLLDATSITLFMSDAANYAGGSALNDSLYHFIENKSKIDRELNDLPRRLSQLVMDGEDIDEVQERLSRRANELKDMSDQTIVDFIKRNINNPLGAGVFMVVTIDNKFPTLTPAIEEIFLESGRLFRDNAYIKKYIKIAEENMLLLREGKEPIRM
ncbi:MAG: DUF4369 domain-containing protein [Bacteroidaceae bacterium]|nr:DUF4369 domain-containing protein [Bacteroidaceae bacterium]